MLSPDVLPQRPILERPLRLPKNIKPHSRVMREVGGPHNRIPPHGVKIGLPHRVPMRTQHGDPVITKRTVEGPRIRMSTNPEHTHVPQIPQPKSS